MNTLEDEIAALLKAAPGEPPVSLDADALLETRPHRTRVLAPLLVAAAVVAVAFSVAVATHSLDPKSAEQSSAGRPSRPAWSYVRGHVTAVDVTIVRRSHPRSRYGAPTVRRTVAGPDAQQLARLLNVQPAQRPYGGLCPGPPLQAQDSLVFHTHNQVVRVSIWAACSHPATITAPGRKGQYVYVSGAELDQSMLGALGLPHTYGLGLRSGSRATASPAHDAPTMSRSAAETFARRAINAPASAPTFSRFMTVAQFEQTYDESVTGLAGPHQVWVVTVHAPVTDDGGPAAPPEQHDVYSIVIDATTGLGVTDCAGCDWVTADE